ncbi:MAG TPA: hypothetical protein PK358_09360 [Spirochaetota bacterium]|nr:hypothetical protein [Spirochaetota bacterium]
MRSKKTNALQFTVLIAGIIYIVIGAAFFFAPMSVLQLFADNVSENWIDLVRDHELVAPLYYMVSAYSVLLVTSGILMIMPLFDPLKYRGIVYFNGVIFPFISSIILIKNGFFVKTRGDGLQQALVQGDYTHKLIVIIGVVLAFIFIACTATLFITAKDAKEGRE